MNKIRYLLSFSNIKPNAADKEKMASALLRGAENREKAFSRRRAVPVLRTVLIVLLVICAAAAAVFGIYKAATGAPHAPATTSPEPQGPISDEGYTLITPLYQNDEIYGLFSDLMRCTGFLPPLVTVVDDGTLFSRFNCDEEDKKDVIMSLVAFAEPNEIDIGQRQIPRTLGEEKNIIIATEKKGTFEYIVSINVLIVDDTVYFYDLEAHSESESPWEDMLASELFGWVEAGRVQYNAGGTVSYAVNTDLLQIGFVTKMRIENGLPVIYDSRIANFFTENSERAAYYDQSDVLTARLNEGSTGYGARYYVVSEIVTGDREHFFTPGTSITGTIGGADASALNVPECYFSPPPPELRFEICSIINTLECDWFCYMYQRSGRYIGIPLRLSDVGDSIVDYMQHTVTAYFDPYNSAVPTLDLNSLPYIVSASPGQNGVTVSPDPDPSDPDRFGARDQFYTYYKKTSRFAVYYDGLSVRKTCFSAEQFPSSDVITETVLKDQMKTLLQRLGVSYTAKFDSPFSSEVFTEEQNNLTARQFYSGYRRGLYLAPMNRVSDAYAERFAITDIYEEEQVIPDYGEGYRVHKIYGYKITDAGFVTDLDGRVIGIYNPAYQDGVDLFSVSSAPLYVISSYDGELLYIGLDLPDMCEKFLPFEYVEIPKTDGSFAKFCFGYLQNFTGPYMIPVSYEVAQNGADTSVAFRFEDPGYSLYSFLKYDKVADNYKRITAGEYGDRFVQNLSGTSYRTELNTNAKRKQCGDVRIKVTDENGGAYTGPYIYGK